MIISGQLDESLSHITQDNEEAIVRCVEMLPGWKLRLRAGALSHHERALVAALRRLLERFNTEEVSLSYWLQS